MQICLTLQPELALVCTTTTAWGCYCRQCDFSAMFADLDVFFYESRARDVSKWVLTQLQVNPQQIELKALLKAVPVSSRRNAERLQLRNLSSSRVTSSLGLRPIFELCRKICTGLVLPAARIDSEYVLKRVCKSASTVDSMQTFFSFPFSTQTCQVKASSYQCKQAVPPAHSVDSACTRYKKLVVAYNTSPRHEPSPAFRSTGRCNNVYPTSYSKHLICYSSCIQNGS